MAAVGFRTATISAIVPRGTTEPPVRPTDTDVAAAKNTLEP